MGAPDVNDHQPDLKPSDLRARVLSSLVMVPAVIAAVIFGGPAFRLAVLVVAVLMAWEWGGLTARDGKRLISRAIIVGFSAIGIITAIVAGSEMGMQVSLLCAVLAAVAAWLTGAAHPMWAIIAVVSVVVPADALLWLRDLPDLGLWTVVWALTTVALTDIGGYVLGRSVGGPNSGPR